MRFPKEETRRIRQAVWARSLDRCEVCGAWLGAHGGELDHHQSRRVPQAVSNTWRLCTPCHRLRTDNAPSAAHWCRIIIEFCERYGYTIEAERAGARLQSLAAKGMA